MSAFTIETGYGHPSAVVETLAAAMPREGIDRLRYVRQIALDPNFDRNGELLAYVPPPVEGATDAPPFEGSCKGYCLALARKVALENAPPDRERGYITLFGVHPSFRRRGIGSALLERAEAFLRERGRGQVWISPYAPGYFVPGVDVSAYSDGLEFLKRRGYTEVYRPLAMERPLWDYECPAWIADLREARQEEFVFTPPSYVVDHARNVVEFVEETFPGDWVRVVREALHDIALGDRPERLIVALSSRSNRITGFSHYRAERFGPIGVHPDFRGRGIGHLLTHATLLAQQQAGYRSSWFLWTDDRTADRIYKPAGFKEIRRFAVLKKDL